MDNTQENIVYSSDRVEYLKAITNAYLKIVLKKNRIKETQKKYINNINCNNSTKNIV